MKKVVFSALALFVCVFASAGTKVTIDLTCLKGQSVINLEVDWSQLTIKGLSIEDWVAFRQAEQPENDALEELEKECKPEVKGLTQKVNKKLEKVPLSLVKKDGCKYTLCVRPLDIDNKGNNKIQCLIIDNETEATIADFTITGKGGHWGSLSNLWGDGFKDAGEKLGDIISKAIKKKITYSY